MAHPEDPRQALALRLKALREEHWPDLGLVQQQLAEALGGRKPLSISLISSWENPVKPAVPPLHRLDAYATFFATRRSVESKPYRMIPLSELTKTERDAREELLQELIGMRNATTVEQDAVAEEPSPRGLWHFPARHDVTIVCAQLPPRIRETFTFADPANPDYMPLYTYADPDSLLELHGHVRAANPTNTVTYKAAARDFNPNDYTSHLIVLGGTDWNFLTDELLKSIGLPIKSLLRDTDHDPGGIQVGDELFAPRLREDGQLAEDVALFYRGPNPYNVRRTVTICYGMYGHGTYGVVRALTDPRFRDRNEGFLRKRFNTSRPFAIVSRVRVVKSQALTPDWNLPESRWYEWEGSGGEVGGPGPG